MNPVSVRRSPAVLCLLLLMLAPLSEAKTYKVGIIPYLPAGEFIVADKLGLYKAEGLDVESLYYSSTGDWVRALQNKVLDFSGLWNATQVDMYFGGSNAKRLALMSYDTDDYRMIVRKGMTPAKMKDRPIAVFSDYFGTHWFLHDYLSPASIGIHDVRIVEMNNEEAYKNFSFGRVDGMIFNGKFMDLALANGTAKVADIDRQLYLAATTGGPSYFENGETISRETLKRFLRAWVKAMAWIEDDANDAAYRAMLLEAFSSSLELVGLENSTDYTKRKPRSMLIPLKDLYQVNRSMGKMFDDLIQVRKKIGYENDKPYRHEDMFDATLILEVLRELGYSTMR